MKSNNKNKWVSFRGLWALIALASAPVAGCSGLVDSPQTKAPEQNVRSYYIKLDQPKMQYQYALTSKHDYLPASDVLVMDMLGSDSDSFGSTPIYYCNWSYRTAGKGTAWFYALDQSKAVALGVEINNKYTDSWVELQSPLSRDASWTFISKGESITAKVTQFGISAAVGGKNYDDVVVVSYTGAAGTKGTSWFARGIGTIYSHLERPGDVMFDQQFQSMEQK